MILPEPSIEHCEMLAEMLKDKGDDVAIFASDSFSHRLAINVNNAATVLGGPVVAAIMMNMAEALLENDELIEFYQAKKDAFDDLRGMKQLTELL